MNCMQLRCIMLHSPLPCLRIRRAGFPIRHAFSEFIDRYRVLVDGMKSNEYYPDKKGACRMILLRTLGESDWQIGRTKVFLKDQEDQALEERRDTMLTRLVVLIQKIIRGYFQRKRYLKMRWAAVVIQKTMRKMRLRRRYIKVENMTNIHGCR